MRVDVVIPCFNAARYLGEALRSVFDQGVPDLRVLLVDDGSTDDSAAIAQGFGPQVQVLRQPNSGIAAARNRGIAQADAPWLAFLDADDVWTAGSLACRMAAFEAAEPSPDVVFGRLEQFVSPDLDEATRARYRVDSRPADARFAGTLLARREAFDRAGAFDPAYKVGEMIEWVARAEARGLRIVQIEDLVLRRRVHGNNTVLRQPPAQSDYLRALKGAIDRRRAGGAS